jgi:uncharacterized protein (TIGR03437 family)
VCQRLQKQHCENRLAGRELPSAPGCGELSQLSAGNYRTRFNSFDLRSQCGCNYSRGFFAAAPGNTRGATVTIIDARGLESPARFFYASPAQINFHVPSTVAAGPVRVVINNGSSVIRVLRMTVEPSAPGLFTANMDGQGVPAALALRARADGSQSYEPVMRLDSVQNKQVSLPVDLGPDSDRVFLVLFGTGIRNRSALSNVLVSIGGTEAQVSYAGAQDRYVGLDQVNVLVPRSLAGRGEVDLVLTVDGKAANTVKVNIK